MKFVETIKSLSLGWLIALVVFLLCVISLFFGPTAFTPFQEKVLIALLALAILV